MEAVHRRIDRMEDGCYGRVSSIDPAHHVGHRRSPTAAPRCVAGAERGQPLSALYDEYPNAARPGGSQLLPTRLIVVQGLDATMQQPALERQVRPGRRAEVRFRVAPAGRFDMVLLPMGRLGETLDRRSGRPSTHPIMRHLPAAQSQRCGSLGVPAAWISSCLASD